MQLRAERGREMEKDEVILLDFWASPFAARVKIALAEKGVEYKAREEDLLESKSPLLLQSNPVHKKVPVLLHKGKPVCESLVILDYIDDVWPSPPLLPQYPRARATARFWAHFADTKLFEAGTRVWKSKPVGEARRQAAGDFIEALKLLEGALVDDKEYFGGERFGYLDAVVAPLTSWFHAYELCGGFKVADECPVFDAWAKRCAARENVAAALPDPDQVYELVWMMRRMYDIE
ncbi:hypothetical protein Taro_019640 [Colocasia esculenta]|uniref:Glutathione S-transferase n=1 Tax=Colocasia esculenta TaxID=4460 RepID=A0A843UXD1_COLES|nr:hypothetical protein [Colocasia esculenta]